jgi:putative flippase GtrA
MGDPRRRTGNDAMWFRQFLSFAWIGALAFFVDAGVLFVAMEGGLGPYVGRCLSWTAAATFTWYLNRVTTFRGLGREESRFSQWGRFLMANSVGGGINLFVYAMAIAASDIVRGAPWLGVALGSIAGLIANFLLSKRLVFQKN